MNIPRPLVRLWNILFGVAIIVFVPYWVGVLCQFLSKRFHWKIIFPTSNAATWPVGMGALMALGFMLFIIWLGIDYVLSRDKDDDTDNTDDTYITGPNISSSMITHNNSKIE